MTSKLRDEQAEVLRFGGGVNSRSSEDQIDPLECTIGQNFVLDPGNGEFKRREPIDLVGVTPNAGEIRGFVTLKKADGTVTMLVQSAERVYQWDGSTFTLVGTVDSGAKLRGPKEANWALEDKVLITDLNLADDIHEWDGSNFSQTNFLTSDGITSFGSFRARYCLVENERAFYANIHDNGANFEHLLVSSKRGDYLIVSASDRPSSALGADAPWFLPMPQLKPINGLAFAFSVLAVSQESGAFEKLTGNDSTNYDLDKLHYGSGSVGRESVVSTSNDIIYGASGHVESLKSTDKFGDVELDDLSFKIRPDIESFAGWTLQYNPRLRRIYCFPDEASEVWVLHEDFIGSQLSPWSKWVTNATFDLQITASMMCLDPVDKLEYVFTGDSNGNVYKMEGSGLNGDAGNAVVTAKRTSKLFTAPLDSKSFNINGWLEHRKKLSNTAEIRFLYAGEHVHDILKTIGLSALTFDTVYNDGVTFYGGQFYYGPAQENRLVRKKFGFPGYANQFQVETSVEGLNEFAFTELGIRYDFAV